MHTLSFSYVENVENRSKEYSVLPEDLEPLTHSRSIKRLDLSSSDLTDAIAEVISRTPVTRLSLYGSFELSTKGACLLTQLTQLSVTICDRHVDSLTLALPSLKLSYLYVDYHRSIANCEQLLKAISSQPLQQLSLASHYFGISESQFTSMVQMPALQQLHLINHFTDSAVNTLLSCAPGLTSLQLSSCTELTDLGLCCIPAHCKHLRTITLSLIRGASQCSIAALASIPSVQRVVVDGCRNVTAQDCKDVVRLVNKRGLDVVKLK
eukprot:jgi/Chrzof1/10904/Cz05g16170.t1